MSVGGPSGLGTLLVQRLDAVLGTTLSQQANLVSGARPDAVTQAANPEQANAARNETLRHPRETVDRATAQSGHQGQKSVDKAKLDARASELLQARNAPITAFTRSAPTTLGHAARTILALLTQYGDEPASVQGKRPLLSSASGQPAATGSTASANPAQGGTDTIQQRAVHGVEARAGQTGQPPQPGSSAAQTGPSTAGNTAASSTATQGPSATQSAAPITQGPVGTMASQLAQALSQALQGSGIFYESHLSQLATGRMTAQQLMLEPQAAAGKPAPLESAEPQAGRAEQPAVRGGGDTAGQAGPARGAEAMSQQASTAGSSLSGLDPQTHLLVRQQLEVLANQTFAWRGEAWPDAPMEWEVGRDESADAPADTTHWATRIAIQLPRLGQVEARISLSGEQLVMHVVAPESAGILDEHAETLRSRYTAQGLTLSQLSIAVASTQDPTQAKPMGQPADSDGEPA